MARQKAVTGAATTRIRPRWRNAALWENASNVKPLMTPTAPQAMIGAKYLRPDGVDMGAI